MHDDAGNAGKLRRIPQKLAFIQPAGIDEKVVFDPRKGEREMVLVVFRGEVRFRQKRDRRAFPHAPCLGAGDLLGSVIAGQAAVIGGHHLMTLRFRNGGDEGLPFVGKHFRDAELIVPVELRLRQRIDAAQKKLGDAIRMRFGIGECQCRTPGAAEHLPLVDADHFAEPLDIGYQMPCRIGFKPRVRRRAAATALVEQEDVVKVRIEQPRLDRRDPAARSAVKEDDGFCTLATMAFPVDHMPVADIERAGDVWDGDGIERAQNVGHRCKPFSGQFSVSWSGCWKEMICSCRS
ncbi:hypothetical protein D3C73_931210 [compost metagenome]